MLAREVAHAVISLKRILSGKQSLEKLVHGALRPELSLGITDASQSVAVGGVDFLARLHCDFSVAPRVSGVKDFLAPVAEISVVPTRGLKRVFGV